MTPRKDVQREVTLIGKIMCPICKRVSIPRPIGGIATVKCLNKQCGATAVLDARGEPQYYQRIIA